MDWFKGKLSALREELAKAENREEIAKKKTRKRQEKIAKAEDTTAVIRMKIKMAETNLKKVEDKTNMKLYRLERLNKYIYENESFRRELERKEMKEDNTLEHLQMRLKSRKIFAEEAEQRCREANNKLKMLLDQAAKVDKKLQAAKSREMCYQNRLNDAGRLADSLAKSGESKLAKCEKYEERLRRLHDIKERVVITSECLERKAARLESHLLPLRNETRDMKRRELHAKRELRSLLDEINIAP